MKLRAGDVVGVLERFWLWSGRGSRDLAWGAAVRLAALRKRSALALPAAELGTPRRLYRSVSLRLVMAALEPRRTRGSEDWKETPVSALVEARPDSTMAR